MKGIKDHYIIVYKNMIPGFSTFFHQKLGSIYPFLEIGQACDCFDQYSSMKFMICDFQSQIIKTMQLFPSSIRMFILMDASHYVKNMTTWRLLCWEGNR